MPLPCTQGARDASCTSNKYRGNKPERVLPSNFIFVFLCYLLAHPLCIPLSLSDSVFFESAVWSNSLITLTLVLGLLGCLYDQLASISFEVWTTKCHCQMRRNPTGWWILVAAFRLKERACRVVEVSMMWALTSACFAYCQLQWQGVAMLVQIL